MTALLCLASIGRSGSTFLQRLLNTHPELVIFGEHEGFLTGVRSAYERLVAPRTSALFDTGQPGLAAILNAEPVTESPGGWSIEWTNALRPAAIAPAFAQFVEDLLYPQAVRLPTRRYWGFKEIRYGAEDLDFLGSIFPQSRFLMLMRDPVTVYRSQCRLDWGRQAGPENAAAGFHKSFSALVDGWDALRGRREAGDAAKLVCYERLIADPLGHLDEIAEWLGIAPFDEAKVRAVASAQMTPQRGRWTAESQAFLDAYAGEYAESDRRRYFAASANAIGARGRSLTPPAVPPGPTRPARLRLSSSGQFRLGEEGPAHKRKLIFLHVPMTGGATLREQISAAFDADEICPHSDGLPAGCSAQELDQYRFFSGRFTPADIQRIPGEKFAFTVLRDPMERLLSVCAATLEQLSGSRALSNLRRLVDNDIARQLAGSVELTDDGTYMLERDGVRLAVTGDEIVRLAIANMKKLDLIGFTSDLDKVYARVAHEVGLPQAPGTLPRRGATETARFRLVSSELAEGLSPLIALDRRVYAAARTDAPQLLRPVAMMEQGAVVPALNADSGGGVTRFAESVLASAEDARSMNERE